MREISALKRNIPAAAAKGYADGFWEGVKADEAMFEEVKRSTVATAAGIATTTAAPGANDKEGENTAEQQSEKSKSALLAGLGQLERRDDIERGYVDVVDTLGRLRREMPAVVAKMERARIAGEYTVTER